MTNPNYTHIALVVDRSGSMANLASDMNEAIRYVMREQDKEPGERIVDVTTFDTVIDHPYTGVHPLDVVNDIIVPRGSTALNDALGTTIVTLGEKFAAMDEGDRPGNVIIVVVTDGYENASKEYTTKQVRALVERQKNEWGWVFMYLATGIDAFAASESIGVDRAQTIAFAGSSAGVQNVYDGLHANMSRASRGDRSGYIQSERDAAMMDDKE